MNNNIDIMDIFTIIGVIVAIIGVIFTIIGTVATIRKQKKQKRKEQRRQNTDSLANSETVTDMNLLGIFTIHRETKKYISDEVSEGDNMHNLDFGKNKRKLEKHLQRKDSNSYSNMDFHSEEFYIEFLKNIEEKKHEKDSIDYK